MKVLSAILFSIFLSLSVPSISLAQQTAVATANATSSCAPYDGKWTGDWRGIGQRWLLVKEVDTKCVASHTPSQEMGEFKSTKIEKDTLIIPCGTGTCFFELHGDQLWARYAGSDGAGRAVFKKIAEK